MNAVRGSCVYLYRFNWIWYQISFHSPFESINLLFGMMNELWLKRSASVIEHSTEKPHTNETALWCIRFPDWNLTSQFFFSDWLCARFDCKLNKNTNKSCDENKLPFAINRVKMCAVRCSVWLAFDFNGVRSWNCHAMRQSFQCIGKFSLESFFILKRRDAFSLICAFHFRVFIRNQCFELSE